MQLSNLKELIQGVFSEALFNKASIRRGITPGILVCAILNIGWVVFHIKALEQIKALTRSKESSDFMEVLSKYLKDTLVCLGFRYSCAIAYSFFIEKLSRALMAQFLLESMQLNCIDFVKNEPGSITTTIRNKVIVYRNIIDALLFKFVSLSFLFACSFIQMYNSASDGTVSIVSLTTLFLYLAIYFYLDATGLNRKLRSHSKYIEEKRRNSSRLLDKIHNFDILKSYGLEEKESECFHQELSGQRLYLFNLKFMQEQSGLFNSCFSEISSIALSYLIRYINHADQQSNAVSYMMTFRNVAAFLDELSSFVASLALSVNELIVEDVSPPKKKLPNLEITFKDTIEFKNVSLYHDEKLVVEGIDAVIRKGESVAIVGCNGSGKSTFIRSLLGFTKYTGDILIDGINVRSISNISVLKLISYISQDDYTPDCTVLENIRLGNKKCTREEIERKAKLFDADDTFLHLENGYETRVGAGGSKLSVGQKQKISLVRAAVRNAPIFILDEATSAIDKEYERKALHTILDDPTKKTVLMIIHDKSYLESFDKIFFFSRGKLRCIGKYRDLISTSQAFRQFISSH